MSKLRNISGAITKDLLERLDSPNSTDLCEQWEEMTGAAVQNGLDLLKLDFEEVRKAGIQHDPMARKAFRAFEQGSINEGVSAFGDSKFQDVLNTIYRVGTMNRAPEAEYTLSSCVTNVDVGCEDYVDTNLPENNNMPVKAVKGQSTDYFQLGDVDYRQYTRPSKYKFGYQMFREDMCNRFAPRMLEIMRDGQRAFDRMKEMSIARVLTNAFPLDADGVPSSNIPYIFNGKSYEFYSPIGGAGLWGNYHQSDPNAEGSVFPCPSECDMDFLCFLDRLIEDKEDIADTCLVRDLDMDNMQIVTASRKAAEYIQSSLAPGTVTRQMKTESGCQTEKTTDFRGRTVAGYKYSKHLRALLRRHYTEDYGLGLAEANQMLEKFWAIGDFSQAFVWQTQWPYQRWERGDTTGGTGNVTSENIDNECILTIKHMAKVGLSSGNPCALYVFKPVPTVEG